MNIHIHPYQAYSKNKNIHPNSRLRLRFALAVESPNSIRTHNVNLNIPTANSKLVEVQKASSHPCKISTIYQKATLHYWRSITAPRGNFKGEQMARGAPAAEGALATIPPIWLMSGFGCRQFPRPFPTPGCSSRIGVLPICPRRPSAGDNRMLRSIKIEIELLDDWGGRGCRLSFAKIEECWVDCWRGVDCCKMLNFGFNCNFRIMLRSFRDFWLFKCEL